MLGSLAERTVEGAFQLSLGEQKAGEGGFVPFVIWLILW